MKKRKIDDTGREEGEEDDKTGSAPELLLANKWDLENGPDPMSWWITEKLDGVQYIAAFL